MFSQQLAKFKNETKIKTYLRARGPPGVSGALRSLRILRIGRIGSESNPETQGSKYVDMLWGVNYTFWPADRGLHSKKTPLCSDMSWPADAYVIAEIKSSICYCHRWLLSFMALWQTPVDLFKAKGHMLIVTILYFLQG